MFAERDKHYPSRSGQTSLVTAVANITKPVTNINSGPSSSLLPTHRLQNYGSYKALYVFALVVIRGFNFNAPPAWQRCPLSLPPPSPSPTPANDFLLTPFDVSPGVPVLREAISI